VKPIWYFVGLLLTIIGTIIFGTGIYDLIVPPTRFTVLGETLPNLWWGAVILAVGLLYLLLNRKKTVE
jgi:hypothetical protein